MKWWKLVLASLPAGLGVLISIFTQYEVLANPILYLRGNLSALALIFGLSISAIVIVVLYTNYFRKIKQDKTFKDFTDNIRGERRRFLQRLDHELKNPLTAIRTGLSNMDHEVKVELKGEVSAVNSQVIRMSKLITDLRKLAALETMVIEKAEVNVEEILTEVISTVKNQPAGIERNITLNVPNAPWPLPQIKGDPDLLLLAIHNLLDNAIKFTSPGDTIEVRAFEGGKDIVIEIADTGPGIPSSEIEHVWEELYRGKQARGLPGSGLGLPLVRAIIRLHNGRVILRSRSDQGTSFNLRLPSQ
jgi:two-component system OmpR family sensor kinase